MSRPARLPRLGVSKEGAVQKVLAALLGLVQIATGVVMLAAPLAFYQQVPGVVQTRPPWVQDTPNSSGFDARTSASSRVISPCE